APALEPWLPLLGLVVGLELPATAESAALEEEFVPERIAAVVEAFLAALLPHAALIVVADAHLMDEASAALIGHLAAGIRPRQWLLVVAYRQGEDGFSLPSGATARTIELAPLASSA